MYITNTSTAFRKHHACHKVDIIFMDPQINWQHEYWVGGVEKPGWVLVKDQESDYSRFSIWNFHSFPCLQLCDEQNRIHSDLTNIHVQKNKEEHILSWLLPRKIVHRPISQLEQVRSDVCERKTQVHHAEIWRILSQILFSENQLKNYKPLKRVYEICMHLVWAKVRPATIMAIFIGYDIVADLIW